MIFNKITQNKKLKKIIISSLISITLFLCFSIAALSILGNMKRMAYITEFDLLKTNYNDNTTNYIYHFKIGYYDKIFKHSDIYGVYPDLSNLPDYIKEIKMDEAGSPFGNLISTKIINEEKIDNIRYTLKLKYNLFISPFIVLFGLFILFILFIVLEYKITNKIFLSLIILKRKILDNSAIIIILTFIPILLYFVFICLKGVNVPFWDDWQLLIRYDLIKNSNLNMLELLSLLFSQHNEHRIFFPRIIAIPFLALTKWNVKALMFLSFFVYFIGCFFIIKYFYKNTIREDKSKLFLSIFLTIALFSLNQNENILWGFQICWYIIFASVVISFYFLDKYFKSGKINGVIISLIFGIIASFSSAHGLIVWLSFFSLFILSVISKERTYDKAFISIIVFGIVVFIIYFNNYINYAGKHHPEFFSGNIIKYFLSAVSSSVAIGKINIFAFIFIFLTIHIIIYLILKKKILENAFPLLLLIYSYGFIASLTISRAPWGVQNRYIIVINLVPVSLFILYFNNFLYIKLKGLKRKAAILFNYIFIILTLYLFIDSFIIFKHIQTRKNLQHIVRNYKNESIESLRLVYPPFKNKDEAYKYITILEKNKFGVFSDRYNYLDDIDKQ